MNRIISIALASAIGISSLAAVQSNGTSFKLISHKLVTTTDKDLKAQSKKSDGVLSKDRKSLQFAKAEETIVVWTGPDNDMLSYRVQGKRNPTLVVKPDATLHILFANTDEDMFHDMRFGSTPPPFSVAPGVDGTVGTEQLAHRSETSVNADSITIKAPTAPGVYTYFCSMKGHAKGGMYGLVVVR